MLENLKILRSYQLTFEIRGTHAIVVAVCVPSDALLSLFARFF